MIVVDKVESFIDSLDLSNPVLSFAGNAGATTLAVKNVFHARIGLTCFIDAVPYPITGVDYELNTVTVGSVLASPVLYSMPSPFYFHGTPYATNTHISRLSDSEKVPMIYLLEIVREELQAEDSAVETIADLRLFFLDVANFEDWTTDQHYSNVIRPIDNLVAAFVDQARESKDFGVIGTLDKISHIKFGVYQSNKGHLNSLFNERLSGIELRGSFPFRKECC